jgi:hypothetical protein
MSTSSDGGLTWGPALNTGNNATAIGGQPLVQPNGTVIVPAANASETAIIAFRSTNGGASWSSTVTVSAVSSHTEAGSLRSGPLPTAEIDASGKVYVAWSDCRFRTRCRANDIVFSTSTDGVTWAAVSRVPIDATSSGIDHFIPGLGVNPTTSGSTAQLGLTYYYYATSACGNSCQLQVGYIQSNSAGTTWNSPTNLQGPFAVTLCANTTQGRMVGDYISTSWVNGKAFGAFAVCQTPSGAAFNEPIYVPTGGLALAASGFVVTSSGDHPVPNAASDHASPSSPIRVG